MSHTKNMLCIVCQKNNQKSKLYPLTKNNTQDSDNNLLVFYDEQGNFHDHTAINSLVKQYYKCSNGHNFYTCLKPRYDCCTSNNDTLETIIV